MPNEIIGIVAAIGLTLLLFAWRHFILPAARGKKRRHVAPEPSHGYVELQKTTVEDNGWLPRTPDIEAEVRVEGSQRNQRREQRGKVLRYDERRDDGTIGGEIR
ncbi:MAG TPA: hypothetical protein VN937_20690 [Blastocatellia bacterium]|nr:hypothetical protein [Blastocatellia bacterium]